jgi:hypothetical protein
MPISLQQLVTLRAGLGSAPVVMELHDDRRFVMFRIDKKTQLRTETLFDVPASSVVARGSQSSLVIEAKGVRQRIEFKNPNQLTGFLAGGLIGAAIADAFANPSGIRTWVDALRAHGAQVRYSAMSTSMKVIFITFGALMGTLVLVALLFTVLK